MFGRVYVRVKGTVQNVMFRQTIMRAALARGIEAGATNCKDDKSKVMVTFRGRKNAINELLDKMKTGQELNSWGAQVDSIEVLSDGPDPFDHDVNTKNVNDFKWKDVDVYI